MAQLQTIIQRNLKLQIQDQILCNLTISRRLLLLHFHNCLSCHGRTRSWKAILNKIIFSHQVLQQKIIHHLFCNINKLMLISSRNLKENLHFFIQIKLLNSYSIQNALVILNAFCWTPWLSTHALFPKMPTVSIRPCSLCLSVKIKNENFNLINTRGTIFLKRKKKKHSFRMVTIFHFGACR